MHSGSLYGFIFAVRVWWVLVGMFIVHAVLQNRTLGACEVCMNGLIGFAVRFVRFVRFLYVCARDHAGAVRNKGPQHLLHYHSRAPPSSLQSWYCTG